MLRAGGMACAEVDQSAFDLVSVQKLLWASMFWLLCDVHGGGGGGRGGGVGGGATVGDVIGDPEGEARVRELANELIDVAIAAAEVDAEAAGADGWREGVVEGLFAYSVGAGLFTGPTLSDVAVLYELSYHGIA
jgi:hypothetical protein